MLSNKQHRSVLQKSKITNMLKQVPTDTLSPETSTTTSSGYSTGGSSVSTTINQSLKKSSPSSITSKQHHHQQQEHRTKSKGLNNLLTKLKNLLIPSKPKHIHSKIMRSTTSRQISSTNILRQYRQHSPIYVVVPSSSSLPINNAISLPFTYYYNSPIAQSRSNFEKISAWLDHTEKLTKNRYDSNDLPSIDISQQQSISTSSLDIDNQGITVVMKKTPTNIKPPKRSSSLVTRIARPIIERQSEKTVSPSSSFSSAILTKGMSEGMTPPPPQKSGNRSSKNNRRRTIDFSHRPTIDNTNEHKYNKENFTIKNAEKSPQDIYQFSGLSSNKKTEIHIPPPSKHISTKKYYFHSNPTKTNEDLLNNSYGLTLLNQQQQQQQQKHSTATALMISQVPNQISSQKQFSPQTSIQQHTLDSLDDLLCDREVESYFYPTSSSQSEHIYMNLENPLSLSYIHGTLC